MLVRAARPEDVDDLVELRLENARVHVELDPAVYRMPDAEVVRSRFSARVAGKSSERIWVAELAGTVVAMAELLPRPAPADDQILRPVATADVHIVVRRGSRRRGVARALLVACEEWAMAHGIDRVVAGIHADNEDGLGFYRSMGYRDNGVIAIKEMTPPE